MVSLSVTITNASELAKMKSGWHLTFAPLLDFFPAPHVSSRLCDMESAEACCSASTSPKRFEPNASVQQALF